MINRNVHKSIITMSLTCILYIKKKSHREEHNFINFVEHEIQHMSSKINYLRMK